MGKNIKCSRYVNTALLLKQDYLFACLFISLLFRIHLCSSHCSMLFLDTKLICRGHSHKENLKITQTSEALKSHFWECFCLVLRKEKSKKKTQEMSLIMTQVPEAVVYLGPNRHTLFSQLLLLQSFSSSVAVLNHLFHSP